MNRPMLIIFGTAALIYVILVGAFFIYESRKEQDKLLRKDAIENCLYTRGHIGPGLSCWYDDDRTRPVLQ
jgi:hypothetical protein